MNKLSWLDWVIPFRQPNFSSSSVTDFPTFEYSEEKFSRNIAKRICEYRKKIGMVFQSFQLFDNLTVIENLTLAPILNKVMTREEAYKQAKEYLKQIHLKGKENTYPKNLSGGQKQRVAIVRTLMMNPEVILFDEPTSALDPEMIEEVLALIMEVSKRNITMIVVTHELKFAYDFATRVIFMDKGSIVEDGEKEQIFNNPKTERLQKFLSNIK